MSHRAAAPAIILKPVASAADVTRAAGYVGGTPLMPADFEWPRDAQGTPILFLGQVDLAVLPGKADFSAFGKTLPDLPQDGTLYFFWDVRRDGEDMVVLHAPSGAGPLVAHEVPHDMPRFDDAHCYLVHGHDLEVAGTSLRRRWLEAWPYLSHPSEIELSRNMDRAQGVDTSQRDASDTLQDTTLENVLGRADYPQVEFSYPWLSDHNPEADPAPEGMLTRLMGKFRKTPAQLAETTGLDLQTGAFAVPESFPWRWSVVRDVAEQIKAQATINEGSIYDFWNSTVPVLLHLWQDAPAQADQWIARAGQDTLLDAQEAAAFRAWLDQLANAALNLPVLDAPDPEVLAACAPMMAVLEEGNHRMYTYPDRAKTPALLATEALVPLMGCIKKHVPSVESREYDDEIEGVYWSDEQCPVPYYEEWDAWYVPGRAVTQAMDDAIDALVARCWRYKGEVPQEIRTIAEWNFKRQITLPMPRTDGNNFGDNGRVPLQMFGAAHQVQSAPEVHADKVMLFQMPDGFGLPFNLQGGVLQAWIDPADLAAGRFDRIITTLETT